MPGFVPSTSQEHCTTLREQVNRAARSASAREELEYLMGDVAAEILLVEVDLRRVERSVLASYGPRVQPRNLQAQLELRERLELHLNDLRGLAGEIRTRLQSAA